MQTPVEAPAAPLAPVIGSTPRDVYRGYRERASLLRNQLEEMIDQRSKEISGLRQMSGGDMAPARAVVTERIARLDKRIAGLEEQIAQADAQVATAAGVPGAIARENNNSGYRDEDMAGSFFGGATAMMMLSLVYVMFRRRRARKRGKPTPDYNALPNEIATRMERLEAVAEATALEVERIGEGQRFVTKLLSQQRERLPLSGE